MASDFALRAFAREQRDTSQPGHAGDANSRALAMAGMMNKMRQLAATAAPLIRSLDTNQRRDAMVLVRRLGFESLVASF